METNKHSTKHTYNKENLEKSFPEFAKLKKDGETFGPLRFVLHLNPRSKRTSSFQTIFSFNPISKEREILVMRVS